jgi:DNA-binding NtrC family response regulator
MIDNTNTTRRATDPSDTFSNRHGMPALLIAFSPPTLTAAEACPVVTPFTIGRSSDCDLVIEDSEVSKRHACITRKADTLRIEDLNSTNGTYVNGERLHGKVLLDRPAVIRLAQVVLVYHNDAQALLEPPLSESYGIAGRFHTRSLIKDIREAALSHRHILLTGPSGTGKELSARALAAIMGEPDRPLNLVVHNAASFASEEEAKTTLFGLKKGVFTGVDGRAGLLEQADNGLLFLDEVHNLSFNVQRSLLRVVEEDRVTRIGEQQNRPIHVRLVLSSNAPGPSYGLADDLLARLRVIRVPSLAERLADIPTIFNALLEHSLAHHGLAANGVLSKLKADHYETLCLGGFPRDNVRGLLDLADRLSTKIKTGVSPTQAIVAVFRERFGSGPLAKRYKADDERVSSNSHYQNNKELIIATFRECRGNISATVRRLNSQEVPCSRPWLTKFLRDWGVRD